MLDEATVSKYVTIIKKGQTLKADVKDSLEVVTGDSELSSMIDQTGQRYDSTVRLQILSGKIITKKTILRNGNTILYWAPCDLEGLFKIIGLREDRASYEQIDRADQVSFYGKDIKKAFNSVEDLDDFAKEFKDNFIETEHPVADNIFYSLYFRKNRETNKLEIKCSRNLELSPRPVKEDVAETPPTES